MHLAWRSFIGERPTSRSIRRRSVAIDAIFILFTALYSCIFLTPDMSVAQNPSSRPGDIYWSNRFADPSLGGGMNAIVTTPDKLYATGVRMLPAPGETFTGFRRYNVFMWDGNGWQVTGPGDFTSAGFSIGASAIAVEGTEVYLGGPFDAVDSQPYGYIASWNNDTWNQLGYGLNGEVRVIRATGNTEIFVGGLFSSSDTLLLSNIARWDGTWHPMYDAGESTQGVNGGVTDLSFTSANTVYAVGGFSLAGAQSVNGLARWIRSPEGWTGTGTLFSPTYPTMVSTWGSYVFVAGQFDQIDGTPVNALARYESPAGPWTAMGNPVAVGAMAAAPTGDLYASTVDSGSGVWTFSSWDGVSWTPVPATEAFADHIAFQGTNVFANGYLSVPGKNLKGLGMWDGSEWHALGNGIADAQGEYSDVRALAIYNGKIFAGGQFGSAGGDLISGLCTWSGSRWEAVGEFSNGTVSSIEANDDFMYIAGGFGMIDTVSANGVARWDGSQWSSLAGGLAGGAKVIFLDGQYLYAYEWAASPPRMKRWDGTSWSNVGNSFSGGEDVLSIAKLGNDIYVCGGFLGSTIRKWNGGATWSDVPGLNDYAYTMNVFNNSLYVGGKFTMADGNPVSGVARWDGTSWHAVDPGLPGGIVRCMEFDAQGNLYVGGEFGNVSTGTGDSLFSVAKWDGSHWTRLGTGVFHSPVSGFPTKAVVFAMQGTNDGLYLGGEFTHAGDKFSRNIALWTDFVPGTSGATAISVQPGWNIVSLPRTVFDYRTSAIFPTASSNAFAYTASGYVAKDTLHNGIGYWLKFAAGESFSISGQERNADTIDVGLGWNLIGSISSPVPVTGIASIPPGIATSPFFGYDISYVVADTIYPGRGYWVKVNQPGTFVLSSSVALPANTIRIVPTSEKPPPPTDR